MTEQLIKRNALRFDEELIHVAALLHDIGYYPLFDDTGYVPKMRLITHGVVGAEILRKEGIAEEVCRIAERHTGVGLTKESIIEQGLPLPARDLVAKTSEERLIMYTDKLHTKAIQVNDPHDTFGWFVSPESYLEHARRFGEDNAMNFTRLIETYGTPNLKELAVRYNQELK